MQGDAFAAQARANQIEVIPVAAPRGLILDRHGVVLVRSRPSFVCALIPSEVTRHREDARGAFGRVEDPGERSCEQRLLNHHNVHYKNFDEVQTYEPNGPVILATDLTPAQTARLAESQSDLPGVDWKRQPVRNYPYGKMGAHLFGYVGAIDRRRVSASQARRLLAQRRGRQGRSRERLRPLSARPCRRPAGRSQLRRAHRCAGSSRSIRSPATRWSRRSTGGCRRSSRRICTRSSPSGAKAAGQRSSRRRRRDRSRRPAACSRSRRCRSSIRTSFATPIDERKYNRLLQRQAQPALRPRDRRRVADRLDVQDGHRLGRDLERRDHNRTRCCTTPAVVRATA